MSDHAIHPFSNGFEYECWTSANCDRCTKVEDCDLEYAVALACVLDGTITPEIATRLGYSPELNTTLGWPCLERELIVPPAVAAGPGEGGQGNG